MVVLALEVLALAGACSSSAVVIDIAPNAVDASSSQMSRFLNSAIREPTGQSSGDIQLRLPERAPAIVNAIPPAISTPLMIGDTRSLLLVCTPMFISPALIPCVSV
jgi:hypothetical protein